jgi:hypothetical protein
MSLTPMPASNSQFHRSGTAGVPSGTSSTIAGITPLSLATLGGSLEYYSQGRRELKLSVGSMQVQVVEVRADELTGEEWWTIQTARDSYAAMWPLVSYSTVLWASPLVESVGHWSIERYACVSGGSMMSGSLFREMRLLVACCCLLVLLAACDPFGSSASGPTPTLGTSDATATLTAGGASAPTPTTARMPATQTACPPAGMARAAVFAPLALGPHQNVVYVFNQEASPTSWSGAIKRYDVSTSQKVRIVSIPHLIVSAQISADGQWILFTTQVTGNILSGEMALQLVRMDGQGLQTLFCVTTAGTSDGISNIVWSPDQKTVVFLDGGGVDLLDLASGHLQVELVEPTAPGSFGASPAVWLDETHLYMTSLFIGGVDGPLPQSLSVLDTAKGAHQQVSDLIKVFASSGPCLSFASSVDHARLFVSTCHLEFGDGPSPHIQQGPSAIISEPALGGSQTAVYTNPTFAIAMVRVISRTAMLLLIQNEGGDTSHNGIWKMNLDGTGLTRQTTEGAGQMSSLNLMSQSPWSNVSRDGHLYALNFSSNQGTTQALLIGSLAGTSASTFATVSSTVGNVAIVGWTTM